MLAPPKPCVSAGCGDLADSGCRYCPSCQCARDAVRPLVTDHELDVQVLTIKEKLHLDGPRLRRLKRLGTTPCLLCRRPGLPGRMYCSDACRAHARRYGAPEIEVQGIFASVRDHADRLGISPQAVWRRMKFGLSVEEALTTPIGPQRPARGPRRRQQKEMT